MKCHPYGVTTTITGNSCRWDTVFLTATYLYIPLYSFQGKVNNIFFCFISIFPVIICCQNCKWKYDLINCWPLVSKCQSTFLLKLHRKRHCPISKWSCYSFISLSRHYLQRTSNKAWAYKEGCLLVTLYGFTLFTVTNWLIFLTFQSQRYTLIFVSSIS